MKRSYSERIIFALLGILLLPAAMAGQASSSAWKSGDLSIRSFVENQGQFDRRIAGDPIRFGYEGEGQQVFLSDHKVYFYLYQAEIRTKTEAEQERRELRKKQGFATPEAFTAFEKEGRRFDFTTDLLEAEWIGTNPAAELVPSQRDPFTHSYESGLFWNAEAETGILSFRKITYRNLYPNIDVEYTLHPESGVKYNLILHPGADLSQVKLRYSKTPELQSDGSLLTRVRFGEVVDHPPFTIYLDSGEEIISAYRLNGNEISFELAGYDPARTVVIDPWTDLPNDPGSNWNCAWECETDALGNSYAIFGAMPLQLRKYNAAGAIQWTYNTTYDTTAWLGTFVTDDAGNSYVTNGSVAALRKVSPAGGLLWSVGNITGQILGEFWNIAFNCDQSRLIVGGTAGAFNPEPWIFEVNPANGALVGGVQIHESTGLFNPNEIRAVTATENAKYYWLSHDSIGYISQSFANCPSASSNLIENNGYGLGYKCENWRYNNTGIEAIAYYGGFVFVNRGNRIDKRDFATANIVTSATIPGGAFTSQFGGNFVENSGIVIDNTGRIFVGSRGSVSQFDQNLNLISTTPVTGGYNVYDVDLTSNGQVIACGATGTSSSNSRTGTVESLGILGAAPYVMPCCDASICQVGPLCDTDAPVTLQSAVGGGTWSFAPGFNTSTGEFAPAIAGVGTYTFYNTVACGTDSLVIDVVFCPTLSICVELNGDLTVSNGTGPYTWEQGTIVTNCPFGPGPGCNFITNAVNTLTWTSFTTGTTITPPPGADTIRVIDSNTLEYTSWDISNLPPCSVLPAELILFEGEAKAPQTNELLWVTSSESNSHHFSLQHSPDGQNWAYLGQVPAAGNSTEARAYRFTDRNAFAPITWYRLNQTDLNGLVRQLSTIAVHSENLDQLVINIFPNPTSGQLNFNFIGAGNAQAPLNLKMVNSLGQVVLETSYAGLAHNALLSLDLSDLAAGIYEISFQQGDRRDHRKLLVLPGN